MINNYQKETQTKLTKGLLDMIVLQYLDKESMHGYELITKNSQKLRRLLRTQHYLPIARDIGEKRLRRERLEHGYRRSSCKRFKLTNDGKNVLSFTESSLNLICKNMATDNNIRIQAAPLISARSTLQRENPPLTVR